MRAGLGFPSKNCCEAEVDEDTTRDIVFAAQMPTTTAFRSHARCGMIASACVLNERREIAQRAWFSTPSARTRSVWHQNVKWIVEIEAYAGDYKGYWQRKGWTDDATIKTFSRIDSPGHYQTLRGPEQRFRGIAFGGPNSISRVEISLDAARTWDSCEIETPMSPYSWVIWNYTWRPQKRGKYQVAVRAIDSKGQLQIAELIRPQPAGSSGLHTIIADIGKPVDSLRPQRVSQCPPYVTPDTRASSRTRTIKPRPGRSKHESSDKQPV